MKTAELDEFLGELDQIRNIRQQSEAIKALSRLLQLGRCDVHASLWQDSPVLFDRFSDALTGVGMLGSAFRLAYEGRYKHRDAPWLIYRCASALARMGDVKKADHFLRELSRASERKLRVDSLSLHGRLLKDRFQRTLNAGRRRDYARSSAESYRSAYDETKDPFPAINAATMFLVVGDFRQSREIAEQVLQMSQDVDTDQNVFWHFSTIAEAQFILGDVDQATDNYRRAVSAAGGRLDDVASMRRNARLISDAMQCGDDVVRVFDSGCVVACIAANPLGHIAAECDGECRLAVDEFLDRAEAGIGYCIPRPGAEMLFAGKMRERHRQLHVVLPFPEEQFVMLPGMQQRSPDGRFWCDRAGDLIRQADDEGRLHLATQERFLAEPLLVDYANSVLVGLAVVEAEQLGLPASVLSLTDPSAAAEDRSKADAIRQRWSDRGVAWQTLELAQTTDTRKANWNIDSGRELKAMLFADLKNFSTLPEYASSTFCRDFNRAVSDVITKSGHRPLFQNSWGDGLHFVFDGVIPAAHFAVALLDHFKDVDFEEQFNLPADTQLRIGMHYGPVYPVRDDPILKRDAWTGSHITRAARIEPVTVPGCIFVSEQFAAAFAEAPDSELLCVPAGVENLAKGYDTCNVYWLGRR
jgi:class 3 adenylate cyclase/tetratricopeptide (TPR) repeat protein